jgi:hypothetical protein
MRDDATITLLRQPGSVLDPLTEIARDGARQMLGPRSRRRRRASPPNSATSFWPDGRQRVVRHGTEPERMIQTGIGPIPIARQKVRDRATDAPAERKTRFSSNILPKWARRSPSLDALLPVLSPHAASRPEISRKR